MSKKKSAPKKVHSGVAGLPVSMTTLDEKLAEWVNIARTQGPVVVNRYDTPWVCIVSYPTWVEMAKLKSFLPNQNHSLVKLKGVLEEAFSYESTLLHTLNHKCISTTDSSMAVRGWILQITYSVHSLAHVCDNLRYNMLWRWFIGLEHISDPLPEPEAFAQDMRMVSDQPDVIKLVYRCLENNDLLKLDSCDLSINFGLIQKLYEQQTRPPADTKA